MITGVASLAETKPEGLGLRLKTNRGEESSGGREAYEDADNEKIIQRSA
jgi:hypothetical protein